MNSVTELAPERDARPGRRGSGELRDRGGDRRWRPDRGGGRSRAGRHEDRDRRRHVAGRRRSDRRPRRARPDDRQARPRAAGHQRRDAHPRRHHRRTNRNRGSGRSRSCSAGRWSRPCSWSCSTRSATSRPSIVFGQVADVVEESNGADASTAYLWALVGRVHRRRRRLHREVLADLRAAVQPERDRRAPPSRLLPLEQVGRELLRP